MLTNLSCFELFALNSTKKNPFMPEMTREGIMPLPDEAEALKNIAILTIKIQLRNFIELINHCRDI